MIKYNNSSSSDDNIKIEYEYLDNNNTLFAEDDLIKVFDKVYNLKFGNLPDDRKFNELVKWIDDEF